MDPQNDNIGGGEISTSQNTSCTEIVSIKSTEEEGQSSSKQASGTRLSMAGNESKQKHSVRQPENNDPSATSSLEIKPHGTSTGSGSRNRPTTVPQTKSTAGKRSTSLSRIGAGGDIELFRNLNKALDDERTSHQATFDYMRKTEQSLSQYYAAWHSRGEKLKKLEESHGKLERERNLALDLIRTQQLESFKRIDVAQWTPKEDTQIQIDLDRLKNLMRSTAKEFAVETMLEPSGDLFNDELRKVVRWKDGENPLDGMNKKKCAMTILNAMLSHTVYTCVIRPPFSFGDGPDNQSNALEMIHTKAMTANKVDAHAWRAQTLRLLRPRLNQHEDDGAAKLHKFTDDLVSAAAKEQATKFSNGPASVLVKPDFASKALDKFTGIFTQAAFLSYELWTRKSAFQVITLAEFPPDACFDVDDRNTVAHTLARYKEHEEEMNGRLIRIMIHPQLRVWGTDEGNHYDQYRVLMPAEVWMSDKDKVQRDEELGDVRNDMQDM